jgi:hypothetical protein
MTLQDIVTFSKLSYFLSKLRTEIAEKYISKTTSITGPVYIGVGDSLEDIIVDGNVQTGVFPKNLQVACSNDYVYVVYPASNDVDVVMLMGCFEVPLEARQTETIDGTDYYVFRSSNAYTYAGKLAFIV